MLPRKAPKIASAAAPGEAGDHISSLPDDLLQHILSFLPAQDAVRTCVLAKRWRHLWKSTTVLRFVCCGRMQPDALEKARKFVYRLLVLRIRRGTALNTCEFRLGENNVFDMSLVFLWMRIALQCNVRVLQLICSNNFPAIGPQDHYPFFISQCLRKLQLEGLDLVPSGWLDFACCPNLEDLEIDDCNLASVELISSRSLKRLTINYGYFSDEYRIPIYAPKLVSLRLEVCEGNIPCLRRMPFLLAAYIKIDSYDDSINSDSDYDCDYDDDDDNQSILLQGLSDVRNLVLMSSFAKKIIFKRDLKFFSSFNKLKSLLLNEDWCEPPDFSALACILKLAPVLEKLTFQLYSEGPKHEVELKLSCKPLEMSSAISRHLKTVEVKCEVYDETINNVLTFLSKQLNIWFQFGG